jgi:pyruvate/2-oxoacid:ferredoxin oxidoreductase alpha subunit
MRVLETGNHLVALAAEASAVEVVPAYPITPQTQIIEMIADLIAEGKMDAEYIPVESEHSACAALVSASLTGARAFSATSSHGLAYMHEMLHYAAGIRVPVVMANVNRALGPGWNIWCDHQDSISQRDTGWLQVYVASHQEAVDTVIQAFRITEDTRVLLPLMMNLDAFVISHTYMDAEVPSRAEVASYLPPYRPLWRLDPRKPVTHGSVVYPVDFSETRQSMQIGHENARDVARIAAEEFRDRFGRWHGDLVEPYRLDDARFVIVAMGSLAAEGRVAVDSMRRQGLEVGLLRVRFFRPFPNDEIRELLAGREGLLVIDRDYSYGNQGALFTEVKGALYGRSDVAAHNLIVGIGGRDVTFEKIEEMTRRTWNDEVPEVIWGDSQVSSGHEVTREILCEFSELFDGQPTGLVEGLDTDG